MTDLSAGTIRSQAALAFVLALLAGLTVPGATASEPAKPAGGARGWHGDVQQGNCAAVVQRCAGCHRPGEVTPFALLSYRDASKRAKLIRSVISERIMPPWKGEPGLGTSSTNGG